MNMLKYLQHFSSYLSNAPIRRVRLGDDLYHEKRQRSQPHNRTARLRNTTKTFVENRRFAALLLTSLTVIVLFLIRPYLNAQAHRHVEVTISVQSKYLQLVIPINRKSDVDLCKTVLSAQVLNYPVPVVVPWGNSSDGIPVARSKRMYHKIARTYAYLSTLPPEAEDAITVLLDGPDTWFQLRPEMLLQSYYRIIRRMNANLETTHGQDIQQKVIFAAYSECNSNGTIDPTCSAMPEAPSEDIPRYLGHGAMVGQAKDIRDIVRRALTKLETRQQPPSKLLPIYQELFVEQESQRRLRQQSRTQQRNHKKRTTTTADPAPAPTTAIDLAAELGIGLDYYNELGFSASPSILPHWQKPQVHLREFNASTPPYWTVSGLEPDLPHGTTWADLDLLTAHRTSIPAMIHHHPTVAMSGRDATGHRRQWWPKLWLAQHARTLYTAAERLPATVVARVPDDRGRQTLFWNRQPSHNKAGVWTPEWTFWHFQDLCADDACAREVFRDDLGPWMRTEWF